MRTVVAMLMLVLSGGFAWTDDSREPELLRPEDRRIIRDLLHENDETLSGRERRFLRELRSREVLDDQECEDLDQLKRKYWGVEHDEDD